MGHARRPGAGAARADTGADGLGQAGPLGGRGAGCCAGIGGGAGRHAQQGVAHGELAAFTERLGRISAEVRDELDSQPAEDWDYAWNAAASARYAEAVQELSPESREGGRELARLHSEQASIEARRDRELQRIEQARRRWEERVEASVSEGDAEAAAEWMEAGRAVFVPEEQVEQRQQQVRSRACLSRWQRELGQRPLETLAALAASAEESLPPGAAEREALEEARQQALRGQRRALAMQFSESLRAGQAPDASLLELAGRAGVIEEPPAQQTVRSGAEPDAFARSAWLRWIDERADGEEADTGRRLDIASAALPADLRRSLLLRLERTAHVPAADRSALSRSLLALHRSGGLGCPGDAESGRALLRLQDEGAELLAAQGAEAASAWLRMQQESCGRWVCFGDAS